MRKLNAKILSQGLGQSLRRIFFIDENKPRFVHTSEIYSQLQAAFHHVFFYL